MSKNLGHEDERATQLNLAVLGNLADAILATNASGNILYCNQATATLLLAAEEKMRESQEWLATTLRSIGDAVIVLDDHCRLVLLNPAAESLVGIPESLAVGRPMDDVLSLRNDRGISAAQRVKTMSPHTPSRPAIISCRWRATN